ncbi:MAG: type II toxin-antitoxin system death-on-curing family toxin [Clostridia bacterium]|nr:type II toxin-antitoxin system death-on-curing family toxin [Clostridia bacterium]
MILLSVEEVVALHSKLIDKTGGSHGVRDLALLESAIYSSEASFDNIDSYPSIEEKAARLMFALTNNHAFVDGNKRIGVFTMLMTLQLNGIGLSYSQQELIRLGLDVASGQLEYSEILDWILKHKI